MWKVERENHYYKIYDKRKHIAGYFAPEYGEIYPEEKADEIIEQMHKRQEKVKSGYLMIPMLKFGIFNEGTEMDIAYLASRLDDVKTRLEYWAEFMSKKGIKQYKITVSHTDHDMLSITILLVFAAPLALEQKAVQEEMANILTPLAETGLL
ncbi:MAG TPA: hypothetical protein VJ792_01645 [Candidatus Nitrosotalea sp.]|nr:hypothetical protein [Candidatus Nitrosotalea sp.]